MNIMDLILWGLITLFSLSEKQERISGVSQYHSETFPSEDSTRRAPDFNCTTIAGGKIETKSLRSKVIVLNFWFIACTPCRKEVKFLTKLANEYKKDTGIIFISISSMDGKEQLEFVKKKTGFSYQLVASRADICSLYNVDFYPTNIIIYDGEIVKKFTGYHEDIDKKIRGVIKRIRK